MYRLTRPRGRVSLLDGLLYCMHSRMLHGSCLQGLFEPCVNFVLQFVQFVLFLMRFSKFLLLRAFGSFPYDIVWQPTTNCPHAKCDKTERNRCGRHDG